jgi:hypothetical protein
MASNLMWTKRKPSAHKAKLALAERATKLGKALSSGGLSLVFPERVAGELLARTEHQCPDGIDCRREQEYGRCCPRLCDGITLQCDRIPTDTCTLCIAGPCVEP